jgi:hypothetical protein
MSDSGFATAPYRPNRVTGDCAMSWTSVQGKATPLPNITVVWPQCPGKMPAGSTRNSGRFPESRREFLLGLCKSELFQFDSLPQNSLHPLADSFLPVKLG